MRKKFQFNAGLNFQENQTNLSHAGLGSALAEISSSYERVNFERERLCNLLDFKKEELSICKPGSWIHREIQVEIAEIRRQLEMS